MKQLLNEPKYKWREIDEELYIYKGSGFCKLRSCPLMAEEDCTK